MYVCITVTYEKTCLFPADIETESVLFHFISPLLRASLLFQTTFRNEKTDTSSYNAFVSECLSNSDVCCSVSNSCVCMCMCVRACVWANGTVTDADSKAANKVTGREEWVIERCQ